MDTNLTVSLTVEEVRALIELLSDTKGEVLERIYGKLVEAHIASEAAVQ